MSRAELVNSALELFAQNGLSNVTMEDISRQSGIPLETILASYDIPGDILQEAFRSGQRRMEEIYREPVLGGLSSYLEQMFDGLEAMVSPWGPEMYLRTLQQATKDKNLRDAFSRSSRTMGFAIKSFMAQMVALSIVEEIQNVEKVNEMLLTSFIESLAKVLSGEKMENIKAAWVADSSSYFILSPSTNVPFDE